MSENINNDDSLSVAPVEETASVVLETPAIEVEPLEESAKVVDAPVETADVVEAVVEEAPAAPEASVEPAVEDNVISSPKRTRANREPSASSTANNTVASNIPAAKASKKSVSQEAQEEKVAVHSSKNVTWSGVGKVYRGYNIVSKEAAEKWLTRSHIRLATPEEIAQEFGTK